MSRSVSSAEPEKLFRYSDVATGIDHELVSESHRLAGRLGHFEATCTEPGFQVGVGHLGDGLRGYAGQSESVDSWVRQVGLGFQMADRGSFGTALWPGDVIRTKWPLIGWTGMILLAPLLPVPLAWLMGLIRFLPWVRNADVVTMHIPQLGDLPDQSIVAPPEHKSWKAIRSAEITLSQNAKDLEGRLEDLYQQEQQLLERRRQLEAELERWQNRIVPDKPFRIGFDDSGLDAPWRTKADVLEDEIAAIDTRLHRISEEFKGAKQALEQTRRAYEHVVKIKGNWLLLRLYQLDRMLM